MLAQTLCEKRGGVQKEETTITFKSKFTRQSHSSLIVELLQRQWRMRNVFFFSPLWGFWVSVSGAFLFMCLFRFFFRLRFLSCNCDAIFVRVCFSLASPVLPLTQYTLKTKAATTKTCDSSRAATCVLCALHRLRPIQLQFTRV